MTLSAGVGWREASVFSAGGGGGGGADGGGGGGGLGFWATDSTETVADFGGTGGAIEVFLGVAG